MAGAILPMLNDPKSLKFRDKFFASHADRLDDVSLWCVVTRTRGDVIYAEVINGLWNISFDRNTGRDLDGYNAVIVSTEKSPYRDYNDAINHMRAKLREQVSA